jgi:addiction module HigA family antidote
MMMQRKPTHPGEVFREDVLIPLRLTVTEAAKRLRVSRKALSTLLNCKSSMTPEMAVRIGKATKTTPQSWLYMQAKYDLWKADQDATEVEEFAEIAAI